MQQIRLRILGVVERRADAVPMLQEPGDAALVTRGHDRLLVMRCPCGCAEDVIVNLDPNAGPAWAFYQRRRGASLYPSVWRDTGCQSHFIVWDNRILLFRGEWGGSSDDEYDVDIDRRVLETVDRTGRAIEFRDIARELEEVPWAVLASCRRLSSTGRLMEIAHGTFAPGAEKK